jgi:hypothetical protein
MEVSGQFHVSAALPPGKEPPRYPLARRLDGPQSRSGRGGEQKILHFPRRELNSGHLARNLVTILTELPRLSLLQ